MHFKTIFLPHIHFCFIEGMIIFINKNMPSKKSLHVSSL